MDTEIITEARITAMPKDLFDPMPEVFVKTNQNQEEQRLFRFYPDEIMFHAQEFIGLTITQALELFGKKDRAFLQS